MTPYSADRALSPYIESDVGRSRLLAPPFASLACVSHLPPKVRYLKYPLEEEERLNHNGLDYRKPPFSGKKGSLHSRALQPGRGTLPSGSVLERSHQVLGQKREGTKPEVGPRKSTSAQGWARKRKRETAAKDESHTHGSAATGDPRRSPPGALRPARFGAPH